MEAITHPARGLHPACVMHRPDSQPAAREVALEKLIADEAAFALGEADGRLDESRSFRTRRPNRGPNLRPRPVPRPPAGPRPRRPRPPYGGPIYRAPTYTTPGPLDVGAPWDVSPAVSVLGDEPGEQWVRRGRCVVLLNVFV